MRTHVISSVPPVGMRTHKEAVYIRAKGDKFRPLRIARPTLAKVGATLRQTEKSIRSIKRSLKQGQVAPAVLGALQNRERAIKAYLAGLGKPAPVQTQGVRAKVGSMLKRFAQALTPARA
jgi:hypothetical protein